MMPTATRTNRDMTATSVHCVPTLATIRVTADSRPATRENIINRVSPPVGPIGMEWSCSKEDAPGIF